jgi:hypothetical protein
MRCGRLGARTGACVEQLVESGGGIADSAGAQRTSLQAPGGAAYRCSAHADVTGAARTHGRQRAPHPKMSCSGYCDRNACAASALSGPGSATSRCTSAGKSEADTMQACMRAPRCSQEEALASQVGVHSRALHRQLLVQVRTKRARLVPQMQPRGCICIYRMYINRPFPDCCAISSMTQYKADCPRAPPPPPPVLRSCLAMQLGRLVPAICRRHSQQWRKRGFMFAAALTVPAMPQM